MALNLDARPILFVGGKGGVGKTTTAAALGVALAARGERVLLVSTDPAHSLGDLFERRLGEEPEVLVEGAEDGAAPGGGVLMGLEIRAEAEVDRYLASIRDAMRAFVRPALYDEVERQMALTRESPGAAEAALMERVAGLVVEGPGRWDRILFDTAPTGHTLRLLALPELMAAWTDGLLRQRDRADDAARAARVMGAATGLGGREEDVVAPRDARIERLRERLHARRRLFSQVRRALLDPAQVGFLLVLIPERLPILETEMALRTLSEHRVPVLGLVVNRVLPAEPLGDFLEARRAQEGIYLDEIRERLGGLPHVQIPLARHDVVGLSALQEIGRQLLR